MKLVVAGFALLCLGACGELRPDHHDGAAAVPTTAGGLAGPQEGSPGNAENLGNNNSTTLQENH